MPKNYVLYNNEQNKTILYNNTRMDKILYNNELVYQRELTVFSAVSVATSNTGQSAPYDEKNNYSAEYPINFSDYTTLKITGTEGFTLVAQGTYSVDNAAYLEYKIGNGSWVTNALELARGYDNGSVSRTINSTMDISNLTGTGFLRIHVWARNSNISYTSNGRTYVNNVTCIAQ